MRCSRLSLGKMPRLWFGVICSLLVLEVAGLGFGETGEGIAPMTVGQQWALLIGVGQYPEGSGIGQLSSPRGDVERMSELLKQFAGFSKENIVTLTDEKATYREVNRTLQELRGKIRPDDCFIFFFSGRGSRVPDDIFIDEDVDKHDECLLLHDTIVENLVPVRKYLRDDELGKHLELIHAERLLVILDTCYQGNNSLREKGISAIPLHNPDEFSDPEHFPPHAIVFEACEPSEVTADGVFTTAIVDLVRSGKDADGIITIDELHERAQQKLNPQKPKLSGSSETPVSISHPLLPITSEPTGAVVSVEKTSLGTTPTSLVLPFGSYQLQIKKRGYRISSHQVKIAEGSAPGAQRKIDAALKPVEMRGRVKFRDTNLPAVGATVTISGMEGIQPVKTESEGRFVFRNWKEANLSDSEVYHIRITDDENRIEPSTHELPKLSDFFSDVSLGELVVDRLVTIMITVPPPTGASEALQTTANIKLGGENILDEGSGGVYTKVIRNPRGSLKLEFSQEGYEPYSNTIQIPPHNHEYRETVPLRPALIAYTVEVTNQRGEPVSDIVVHLNGEEAIGQTKATGALLVRRRLPPDRLIPVALYKNGRKIAERLVEPMRLASQQYRLPILLDSTRLSLFVTDLSGGAIPGVRISVDGEAFASTDEQGMAALEFYRMPNSMLHLGFTHQLQPYGPTALEILNGGRFTVHSGPAEVIASDSLRIPLPILPEATLALTLQDQKNNPLERFTVVVNGRARGETSITGELEIADRLDFSEGSIDVEFRKHGETYTLGSPPRFTKTGANEYKGIVTLEIPYGFIDIRAQVKLPDGQLILLYVNAAIEKDEKVQNRRLPTAIRALPGVHQLLVRINKTPYFSGQITVVPEAIRKSTQVNLEIALDEAWRICLEELKVPPNDVNLLKSSQEIATAIGRPDLAEIFARRKSRLQ